MAKKAKEECFSADLATATYEYELTGVTPLLMHADHIEFVETLSAWRSDPQNKKISVAGDDRSPAWSWIGYLYTDERLPNIFMCTDNLKTMLREAGSKIPTGKGRETYKVRASYGLQINDIYQPFFVGGKEISKDWISELIGDNDFAKHQEAVLDHGFELFVKRAKIGSGPRANKHIRVRPKFDAGWQVRGQIEVIDESESGLKEDIVLRLLQIGGQQIGLCDWRPSCPNAGSYGKFRVTDFKRV